MTKKRTSLKNLIIVGIFFLVSLFSLDASPVQAHNAGLPFLKINGQYVVAYPIPSASSPNFALPQDAGDKNYLQTGTLNFELDSSRLSAPPEIINKTTFSWDFGDGQKDKGLKVSHKYAKIGSFILIIYAQDDSIPTPQILDTVLVNVLPNSSYKLPAAIIKIADKQSDHLKDGERILVNFDQKVFFDGSVSKNGSGKIVSFLWDFGDGNYQEKVKTDHKYPTDLSVVFPLLRVVDENGFINDAYVWVDNGLLKSTNPLKIPSSLAPTSKASEKGSNQLMFTLLGIFSFIMIFTLFWRFVRKKPKVI